MVVHFISPYRQDKNLGKAINDAVGQLNAADDDWVVHVDQDVAWLLPDSKAQLIDILSETEYDILGPVTNRVGVAHQTVIGMWNESRIDKHIAMAKGLQSVEGGKTVVPTRDTVAAMVMCFKIGTWKKLAGFHENVLNFDIIFCMGALRASMKIGVMHGVYVLHLYRWGSADPQNSYFHLVHEQGKNKR